MTILGTSIFVASSKKATPEHKAVCAGRHYFPSILRVVNVGDAKVTFVINYSSKIILSNLEQYCAIYANATTAATLNQAERSEAELKLKQIVEELPHDRVPLQGGGAISLMWSNALKRLTSPNENEPEECSPSKMRKIEMPQEEPMDEQ